MELLIVWNYKNTSRYLDLDILILILCITDFFLLGRLSINYLYLPVFVLILYKSNIIIEPNSYANLGSFFYFSSSITKYKYNSPALFCIGTLRKYHFNVKPIITLNCLNIIQAFIFLFLLLPFKEITNVFRIVPVKIVRRCVCIGHGHAPPKGN